MVRHRAAWRVQLRGPGRQKGRGALASLFGHQETVSCSFCLQSGDKEGLETDRASWQESKGAEKGKTPSYWPLLFSIGTINTILKCYGNLRSLF